MSTSGDIEFHPRCRAYRDQPARAKSGSLIRAALGARWTRGCCALVLGLAVASGCDEHGEDDDHAEHDDDHGEHDDLTPFEEACEHHELGPAVSVASSLDPILGGQAHVPHHRVDIGLVLAQDGQYWGYVFLDAAAAGSHEIFASAAVPMAITDAAGTPVALQPGSYDLAGCSAIASAQLANLGIGRYTIAIGPTTLPALSVVVEAVGP